MNSTLVVISHYNAWEPELLIRLLDQMQSISSGHPFDCLIVVNQAERKPLELPARHSGIKVLYRENSGYNIGAWDHGWRESRSYDSYLFLQEECQILRADWLKAFHDAASKPGVGLVGESLNWRNLSWNRIMAYTKRSPFPDGEIEGRKLSLAEGIKLFLDRQGIPLGKDSTHLQSLILFASREVMEAIDGFPIGSNYGHAIASEVAISKRVEAVGLRIRTVGIGYFRYILHPQWKFRQARPVRLVFSYLLWNVEAVIPVPMALVIRRTPSYVTENFTRLRKNSMRRLSAGRAPFTSP